MEDYLPRIEFFDNVLENIDIGTILIFKPDLTDEATEINKVMEEALKIMEKM